LRQEYRDPIAAYQGNLHEGSKQTNVPRTRLRSPV
jgi:hypothetical protein